jgi:hypothetical protein
MYWSNGSFDWTTTYSEIPISLRRFYLKKIEEIIEKQNKDIKADASGGNKPIVPSGPFRPKGSPPPLNRRNNLIKNK